jgi:hypothetical protein
MHITKTNKLVKNNLQCQIVFDDDVKPKKARRVYFQKKPSDLDLLVLKARSLDGDARERLLSCIIRKHGGLGAMMRSKFGSFLAPYEILSFMWISLLGTVEKWDEKKFAASTDWKYRTMVIVRKHQKENIRKATIRIPPGQRNNFIPESDAVLANMIYEEEEVNYGS